MLRSQLRAADDRADMRTQERDEWRDAAQSSVSEQERGEWQRERDAMTDALATAQQEQLEADVMSLSHPVCQQLLTDKREAQTTNERLTALLARCEMWIGAEPATMEGQRKLDALEAALRAALGKGRP